MRYLCVIVILAATPLSAFLGGCKTATDMAASVQKPSIKIVGTRIDSLASDSAGMVFDVQISNPYELPLPLTNVDYSFASRGTSFLSGVADVQGTIPVGESKTFAIPARIDFAPLLATVKGVRPGQVVPYQADLNLNVAAPVVGKISVPVKRAGDIPVPAVPEVLVQDVKWQDMGLTNASGVVKVKIKNTNEFSVELHKLGFNLGLGGKQIATGSMTKAIALKPGDTATIDLPVSFSLVQAGLGAFTALSDKAEKYKISGIAQFGTPFGPTELAY